MTNLERAERDLVDAIQAVAEAAREMVDEVEPLGSSPRDGRGPLYSKVPCVEIENIQAKLKAWTEAGNKMLRLIGRPEASQDEHGGDAPAGVRA
jgi:hypothetical protein